MGTLIPLALWLLACLLMFVLLEKQQEKMREQRTA